MKQSLLSQGLVALFSKLRINNSYVLDGFHLDFFLSLYHALDVPAFILLPDNLFDVVLKYLSVLQENNLVAFVPPVSGGGPAGFVCENSFQFRRSRGVLSSGVESASFIICAESGVSLPLVGSGSGNKLSLSSDVCFDDCLDFFSNNGYRHVDVVLDPGDYSIRGGLLDVFPFFSTHPVRLSFLDDAVDVRRIDVQSQLSTDAIEGLCIDAKQKGGLFSFKECSLAGFLCLFYNPDGTMKTNGAGPVGFSGVLTSLSFEEFVSRGGVASNNVQIDDALTSVGVVNKVGEFIVPRWFIGAPAVVSAPLETPFYVPLNITNVKRGDYLVHRDHGVGICMGLHSYNDEEGESDREFLSIKYNDGGVIRLDVGRLDIVNYYADGDTDGISLDSLNKKAGWSRRRRAAQRHAEETIEYLLNLYVRRNDLTRPAFLSYNDMEDSFLNDFPYRDTDDQVSAWREISDDLSSDTPMDRLLCGDVGFGKTEIALRAAFRVVLGGLRVLVLAPTTLLANQLYASFYSRLNLHAVNVDLVSRFRSTKKIKAVQESILLGKNDILIGTHSLLNNDIYLKNIGLLIVDEEHRFGVRQKEGIKCFRENVDVLSMSATPIPRSLNMALSGIYSISLLQSPPLMRMPIITRVDYFRDSLIRDSISFEVDRGGQVYFVHNNIQTIEHITDRIRGLLPELQVIFIHGQEPPHEVEKKMDLFVSAAVSILVCTSIIEAGIDVPNANCIIINNAHLFGLSQLYQIRGRVGRGHRQAYAYLVIPQKLNLSTKAFYRIKTIEENTRLGSGYNISKSDMELRGSGSLFGYKQSGGSGSVGYEMYLGLIQRALHKSGELNTEFIVLPEDILIEIFKQRYIPEDYVPLESLRLSFYKNLSSASSIDEIDNIQYHLTNRFGPLPRPVNNLVQECRLRLMAAAAGVLSIRARGCGVVSKIKYNDVPGFMDALVEYINIFLGEGCVDFHLLPSPELNLLLCLHISHETDKYSLLSSLLDKLKALV